MGFDPARIKKPRITPDKLPEDANRDDRVLALANMLQERGLASSLADAKRLAEGMVDTESRIIKQTRRGDEGDIETLRASLQGGQSAIFDTVLGKTRDHGLRIPDDFKRFVDRSAAIPAKQARFRTVQTMPRKEEAREESPEPMMFDDAPGRFLQGSDGAEDARVETWVESSDDGVVVSETLETSDAHIEVEAGVVRDAQDSGSGSVEADTAPEERPAPRPSPAEESIDLSKVFYSGSGAPASPAPPVEQEQTSQDRPIEKREEVREKKLPEEEIDLFDIFKAG